MAAVTAPPSQTTKQVLAGTQTPGGQAVVINVPGSAAGKEPSWAEAAPLMVEAAAWPLLLIVFILVFRAPLSRLIDRIKELKGGGVELSAETLIRAELPDRQPQQDMPAIDFNARPLETIITAWVNVEREVRDAAMRALSSTDSGRTMPYSTVIRNVEALERSGKLTNEGVRPVVNDLAKIRNTAVHRPDEPISASALEQFVINAAWVAAQLRSVT